MTTDVFLFTNNQDAMPCQALFTNFAAVHHVLTTKNNQTQHYIQQKHKRETEKTALANKTTYSLIGTTFTTSGGETKWALF